MTTDDPCRECGDARLTGWSGSGPHFCRTCSRDVNPQLEDFEVISAAWTKQRNKAWALTAELARVRRERDEAVRLLHLLDNIEARHPDVAAFLDAIVERELAEHGGIR